MNNTVKFTAIPIDKWSLQDRKGAITWLLGLYGFGNIKTWYLDTQPAGCEDLIMRDDIYFMFAAAFGEGYGTSRKYNEST
jgi:hypothetical protein